MRPGRRGTAVLLGGAAALAGWLVSAGSPPPLYDSVGVAPPYRFVCPPAGLDLAIHPPPDPATQTLAVVNGQSPAVAFTTDESPIPQAEVLVGAGSVVLPGGATAITVSATAVVPPQPLPTDGMLDGNVYDIHVTAGGVAVPLAPGALATVVLRGPPLGRVVNLEQFDGRAWSKLETTPVGSADIFGATVTSFTTFALVVPGPPQTHAAPGCLPGTALVTPGATGSTTATGSAGDTSFGTTVVVAAAVAALLLGGGLLVLLRRASRG